MLSQEQVRGFLADGYLVLRGAVPTALARACQDAVWSELGQRGVLRDDRATWTAPVVRIGCPEGGPFAEAGTRPVVAEACDQLIGPGRWWRRAGLDAAEAGQAAARASEHRPVTLATGRAGMCSCVTRSSCTRPPGPTGASPRG